MFKQSRDSQTSIVRRKLYVFSTPYFGKRFLYIF